jgi:hypothetical protein
MMQTNLGRGLRRGLALHLWRGGRPRASRARAAMIFFSSRSLATTKYLFQRGGIVELIIAVFK